MERDYFVEYEMARDEISSLKSRNEELEKTLKVLVDALDKTSVLVFAKNLSELNNFLKQKE